MVLGVLFSVITGLLWTLIGILFSRQSDKPESLYSFLFVTSVVGLPFVWIAQMPDQAPIAEIGKVALGIIPAGLAGMVGFVLLSRAMQTGPHGIAWSISQAAMVFPFLCGWLVFGEDVSWLRLAGMIALAASLPMIGFGKPQVGVVDRKKIFPVFCGAALLLIGLQQVLTLTPNEMGVSEAALTWRVPLLTICWLTWAIPMLLKKQKINRPVLLDGIWYGITNIAGQSCFYVSVDYLSEAQASGIVYPLASGCCIAFFALYCFVVRREKSAPLELGGLALLLCGIGLLAC